MPRRNLRINIHKEDTEDKPLALTMWRWELISLLKVVLV